MKSGKKILNVFHRIVYYKYYKKERVNEKIILIEPQQGRTINGNMFYIIKELASNEKYKNYIVYIALKEQSIEAAKKVIEYNEIKNVNIVTMLSKKYYKLMANAKYLITDTSFLPFFIKKEGQVILNTWHGTPLKYLGKKTKNNYHNIGNVQKNFLISDYLLYPNEYMKEHMIEDYMLENICKAKIILSGYPRNTVFFDTISRKKIREGLGIDDKEVLVYMPTWKENEKVSKMEILLELEKRLKDNQILYVNLHPLDEEAVNYSMFTKIKKFPVGYETYQFLNVTDCLITDYSSVFFDFAISKRKIVLFCYDKEEYLSSRGIYFDYDELPFPKAKNVDELIKHINSEKKYDETKFLEKFCKYDTKDVTEKICEMFILNNKADLQIEEIKDNGKKNVLIYVGNLAKNGITSSLRNLLNNIDLDKYNYYLTFDNKKIEKNKEQLFTFPEKVKFIGTTKKTNMTLLQKIEMILYRLNLIPAKIFEKHIDEIYGFEIKRLYGDVKFDTVIQFSGYEYKKIILYSRFDCNTIIYVHSDMLNEIKTRQNQHKRTLKYAYNKYKKVVLINEDLYDSTLKISKKKDNLYVSHNLIDYKNVIEKSKEEINFNEDTISNVTIEHLKEILNSKSKKYITIGRFSPEKGHERLIKAFNRIYKEDKDNYLIIIGGTGKEYVKTLDLVNHIDAKENVILIQSISNPYSVLNKCDYFVLSSFYEGFGLVIAEADILKKPAISTNIKGPRRMLEENGGTLVENSEDGLFEGMNKLKNGEIKIMNVDYEKYNKKAVEEFYKLMEK